MREGGKDGGGREEEGRGRGLGREGRREGGREGEGEERAVKG